MGHGLHVKKKKIKKKLKKYTSINNKSLKRFKTHNELEIGTTVLMHAFIQTANVRKQVHKGYRMVFASICEHAITASFFCEHEQ